MVMEGMSGKLFKDPNARYDVLYEVLFLVSSPGKSDVLHPDTS